MKTAYLGLHLPLRRQAGRALRGLGYLASLQHTVEMSTTHANENFCLQKSLYVSSILAFLVRGSVMVEARRELYIKP